MISPVANVYRQSTEFFSLMSSGVVNLSLGVNSPFAPVASCYNPDLISHGPIFRVSDTFIGAWSQMEIGGMGATLLVNNVSARDRSVQLKDIKKILQKKTFKGFPVCKRYCPVWQVTVACWCSFQTQHTRQL